MPLVRIDLRRGKSPDHRTAICDAIYQAMKRDAKYPEGFFEGSPETLQQLRMKLEANLAGRSL